MNKMVANPLQSAKTFAQNTHAKARQYVSKRPHRSFRKTPKTPVRLGGQRVATIRQLLKQTGQFLRQEKKLLLKLGILYSVISFMFAGGVSQLDFVGFKDATMQVFSGDTSAVTTASALFLAAVTGSISLPASELQQFLGWLIGFIFWLAIVWVTRMRLANKAVKIRDALYNCCAPLVSTSVLVFIVGVQLLPAAGAVFLFAVLQTGGLLQGGVEVMMFSIAALLLFFLSTYWLSASLLSLVVVTLPGMYPWKALSMASELVVGQRWAIALRLAVMGTIILVLWAVILLPSLLLDGWLRWEWLPIVPLVVQFLGSLSLIFGSVYVYKLYRSLL